MSPPPALALFGAGTLCGEALLSQLPPAAEVLCLSRLRPACAGQRRWQRCDLEDLAPPALSAVATALAGTPAGASHLWISFAPIWLLAPFLAALAARQPAALAGLRAVVACSSSSVITKRFAANRFDRQLVARLAAAQEQLLRLCGDLGVPCRILVPTLIHGRSVHAADRNVEVLRRLLRRSPLLPLPAHTGLRQPIAAADLAAVALRQSQALLSGAAAGAEPLQPLGGDETLTYRALLERIQSADPRAARCRLVSLPTPLFQWLASPLLLLAPKTFAAVQRLSADLAGFPTAAELLGRPPLPFSVPAP